MRNFKGKIGVWLLVLMLVVIAGCGKASPSDQASNKGANTDSAAQVHNSDNSAGQNSESSATVYPLTVQDSTGAEYTFESAPKRVVSLAPSDTEVLFALGLDEQIVGVSDNDDYPEAVKDKPRMGGFQVNVEAVVAANPDLIVSANILDEATAKGLADLGYIVFQSNPRTVEEVMDHIQLIGQITDHQEEAGQVIAQMKSDVDKVSEALSELTEDQKQKVYIEFSAGWTVGKGEFLDALITMAGGVNVASDITGWGEINEENIIQANPDVILYSNNAVDENNRTIAEIVKARSGWNQITAIKEDRVFGLEDNLVSRPGPRITQGLIEIATAIYPELMK